jgi:hypothetical protein
MIVTAWFETASAESSTPCAHRPPEADVHGDHDSRQPIDFATSTAGSRHDAAVDAAGAPSPSTGANTPGADMLPHRGGQVAACEHDALAGLQVGAATARNGRRQLVEIIDRGDREASRGAASA